MEYTWYIPTIYLVGVPDEVMVDLDLPELRLQTPGRVPVTVTVLPEDNHYKVELEVDESSCSSFCNRVLDSVDTGINVQVACDSDWLLEY